MVSLKDIMPTLTIVTGGIILALFILIIEKMYYFFNTRSKQANNEVKISNQNIESTNQVMFLAQNNKREAINRI